MHLNIRSLLPKLDYIKIWFMQTNPDILVLTEFGISRDILGSDINIAVYHLFRADKTEVVEWPFQLIITNNNY
jgi:hypothetical protein